MSPKNSSCVFFFFSVVMENIMDNNNFNQNTRFFLEAQPGQVHFVSIFLPPSSAHFLLHLPGVSLA